MITAGNELSSVLGNHLSQFDLRPLDGKDFSFTDWVWKAIQGQLDGSVQGLLESGARLFWDELWLNARLIRQLLVIALLSALVKCLSDSFKHKSVGEIGFYVCYILLVLLAFSSFQLSIGILSDLIITLTDMMEAAVPLMVSMLTLSGHVSGAALFHPALLFASQLMANFIAFVFIPLLVATAILQIVNFLAEGNPLGKMTELIKKIANQLLKGLVFLFGLLLTLQKISAPALDNVALKTAKAAAGAVPMVGSALNAAMDTVLTWSSAAKSGVLVALVMVICIAVAVPLIKILAVVFTFKIIAALIQPVCDERIVNCLDGMGTLCWLLMNAGILLALMFVYAVVILLSF